MRIPAAALLCLSLIAAGCAKVQNHEEPAGPAAGAEAPLPQDDWCAEHRVPESRCTVCNPALAQVFQAKGDWCAEHGFPESVCPVCHPAAGGGPESDRDAGDEPPADRLKVRLASPKSAEIAGIATEKSRAAPAGEELVVPARLAYDAARRAEINPRSTGVVRDVLVDVGSRVRQGAALVVLESADVGADRSRLEAARTRAEVAQEQAVRQRALHAAGIAAARDVREAERELAEAEAEVLALEAAAGVVGLEGAAGNYTLRAPLAGVVVRRAAMIGRQVDEHQVLLEIVDASVLWAELDVPESRLGEVGVGSEVSLSFDGLAGRGFDGTIASIAPEVDPRTRTAVARVRLENADGALRANMYGRGRIATVGKTGGVRVPRAALQRAHGAEIVFVRLSDTLYETRRVATGARGADWVAVTRGVAAGEDVVSVGSFLLKTETLKGSIGAGCCESN